MHGKFRFFTIWLLHIVDTISSLNCYTLFLYAFVLLCFCIFILLYFYALVFLCSCSLSICLPMLFRPHVFRLYIHPTKNQYAFTPLCFCLRLFFPPCTFASLWFRTTIFLSTYIFICLCLLSLWLYIFLFIRLYHLTSRLLCIPSICSIFYIKTSLTFFYYMITLRS